MLSKNEIKNLRALNQKKFRDLERRFLLEGARVVRDLLDRHPEKIACIFVTKSSLADFKHSTQVRVVEIDNQTLEQLTTSKSPQGVVALVNYPEQHFSDQDFILALDHVQDPGNLGTIIRTMAWFGFKQLVCSTNTVDFCNPKVAQATMGALFDVQVIYTDLPTFLQEQNKPVYGALLSGVSLHQTQLIQPAILVMGNEGNGISEETQKFVNQPISIPKYGFGESLNVATASAIFLHTFSATQRFTNSKD